MVATIFKSKESGIEESIQVAEDLSAGLLVIDSRVAGEGSFWSEFISHVTNGDYPEEES